jgi:hypothetical protein
MAIGREIKEHANAAVSALSVGVIGLGVASEEYAAALKDSVRGVVPQYVTQNVPHVVNSTVTTVGQSFVPSTSQFLLNSLPGSSNAWSISSNGSVQIDVLISPITNFVDNGNWMAQFTAEVVKYTAQFGGGFSQSVQSQLPITLGLGQSAFINTGGVNATQIIFDGIQSNSQNQPSNIFTIINGHLQNVTSAQTHSAIQYVQDRILTNAQALNLVHNHILPFANQLVAIGEVAIAAGILSLAAVGINKLLRKSSGSERSDES